MPAWGRTLERLTDPERFPERVLDGVAALVHRGARGEPGSEPVV